jgi:PPOX class probable F420-dependent enzyme
MPHEPARAVPLSATQRTFLTTARRAVLATIAPDGRPRLVPICFSVAEGESILYTALDDKPKRTADPLALARVRDIRGDPRVSVLADRWDEDWTRLAWLRCDGRAELLEPDDPGGEHDRAIAALRSRYPQYAAHPLESRPIIRVTLERVVDWGLSDRG